MDARQPFDAIAPTYDETFIHRRFTVWVREMVQRHIPFVSGDHVLELGCGTGEDAIWLARRGVHVTATDSSSVMLEKVAQKIGDTELENLVTTRRLDMNQLDQPFPEPRRDYDGVFSNFGPLNCVADRQVLVEFLAQRVRPGGQVVLVVMGPFCPWEIGWYLLHGQVSEAFRRFRSGRPAHIGGGEMVPVWYPTPRRLRSEFAPYFRHRMTAGVGTFLPPSYLDHLVERWPGVFERFAWIDRQFGRYFPLTWLNDHYLAVFERL